MFLERQSPSVKTDLSVGPILLHTVVEPIPEAVESMLDQIFCCSKVEPGINYR
jgi:hypothetical protein